MAVVICTNVFLNSTNVPPHKMKRSKFKYWESPMLILIQQLCFWKKMKLRNCWRDKRKSSVPLLLRLEVLVGFRTLFEFLKLMLFSIKKWFATLKCQQTSWKLDYSSCFWISSFRISALFNSISSCAWPDGQPLLCLSTWWRWFLQTCLGKFWNSSGIGSNPLGHGVGQHQS